MDIFNIYAAHTSLLDNYAAKLAAEPCPNDPQVQRELLHESGLTEDSLSSYDIHYIENRINGGGWL